MESSSGLIIREVKGEDDIRGLVDLTGQCFPEEAQATGMPAHKWRDLKTDELLRNPELWEQCGVAVENDKVIGAVVLTVEDEPEAALSYWEINQRVGCIASLLTMCYDQVLEEPLQDHECLIDFLAVSTEARGKGIGAKLLRWAEKRAGEILQRRVPEAVAEKGVVMTLWVAADNQSAAKLYDKQGYTTVHKTNEAIYACLSSKIFKRFLGHPVWHKMQKPLPSNDTTANTNVPVELQVPKKINIGDRKESSSNDDLPSIHSPKVYSLVANGSGRLLNSPTKGGLSFKDQNLPVSSSAKMSPKSSPTINACRIEMSGNNTINKKTVESKLTIKA